MTENPIIFHGDISPDEIAKSLLAEFNHGNLRAQQFGSGNLIVVQIGSHEFTRSGGPTTLSVAIRKVEDGVSIQMGKQSWLGVAASLGQTVLWTWRNPWNIISRLDDLAQDIEHLQLSDKVWEFIENQAYTAGLSFELSERLKRFECAYCRTANPINESNCISCGAPLGNLQPITCLNCGFVIKRGEKICPNCGEKI